MMKGNHAKSKYGRAQLVKHGLMITTGVFFFGFTRLGLINKVFLTASKCRFALSCRKSSLRGTSDTDDCRMASAVC